MQQPQWLAHAWAELGQREAVGASDNPRIMQFYKDVGFPGVGHDETAWCAAFAGACLERAGIASARSLAARSYANFGEPVASGRPGAIVVLSRGGDPSLGHVGFWLGETETRIILLGGNQGDCVGVEGFDKDRLVAMRWPAEPKIQVGAAPRPAPQEDLFSTALSHVLEVEGGFTDDPIDPGGPTNFGITLATYAASRGESLDSDTRPRLLEQLKAIDRESVRGIYLDRYWRRSQAALLPAGLAIMHFDAAVNHGVSGAARMLQQTLGVAIDGEIGPVTLAAARSGGDAGISRYADLRRQKYRSLPQFWRFGRGWLARVDSTERLALATSANATNLQSATQQGTKTMSDTNTITTPDGKWWGHSLTVWGVFVTGLTTVLPVVGPFIGLDISAEVVRQIGAQATQVLQAVGGLAGMLMAIYGRSRAAVPLIRRDVTVQL